MAKKKNNTTSCRYCGYDFSQNTPSAKLQQCPCGKSLADVSSLLIHILDDSPGETTSLGYIELIYQEPKDD